MLARWRSQPIKYRVKERQPITERLQSISSKSRLSKTYAVIGLSATFLMEQKYFEVSI